VRSIVRALVVDRYKGKIGEAATALGISHPYLSQFLNEKVGAGFKLLRGLSSLTGLTTDELRAGRSNRANAPPEGLGRGNWIARAPACLLKGWNEALDEARAANPEVPGWAWMQAATLAPPLVPRATPDLVADLAFLAWRHTSPEERARLEADAFDGAAKRLRSPPKKPSVE
jgi:transcriptional regulator with XRE-family HTH domain